jgi:carbamoyl-phosphate synthase large subunit
LARPQKNEFNVLFTSVGRRVELLRAFRSAYHALQLPGRIVAVDIDPLASALREAGCPYIVPRLMDSDYIPTLIKICRHERINLIFPLIDPDISVLAMNRQVFQTAGAHPAVVSPEAADIAADKWKTSQFFNRLGLSTPRSWLPGNVTFGNLEYPVFIKPRRGSAAQYTFKVRNDRELTFFVDYVPDPIIQEFLSGPEITNDVICGLDGEVLSIISRQRIEVRWGEVAKGVTVYDPAIIEACVKIAKALPAVGPITVQCMMKEGVPHFTEINARLGGGIPLGIAAGVDSPKYLLAKAAGLSVPIPPLGSYKTGLYITRFDDSLFLNEIEYEKMASRHI